MLDLRTVGFLPAHLLHDADFEAGVDFSCNVAEICCRSPDPSLENPYIFFVIGGVHYDVLALQGEV